VSISGEGVVKRGIVDKLTRGLSPVALSVVDESHRHAGHAGHSGEGESHFRIEVVSEAFSGKSRVERHRMINALLADELAGRVHALAISAKAPAEP
jgi:BolA protein